MTDKEKKLIVDAILEISDITSTHDADYRVRDNKYVGVSKEVATVTEKLAKGLDIADEVDSALTNHMSKELIKDLAKLLSGLLGDAEDDDDDDDDAEDDEEGEE